MSKDKYKPLDFNKPVMVDISLNEFVDLISYADTVAKILKDNGFEGKAEALEKRYMKFKHLMPDQIKEVTQ